MGNESQPRVAVEMRILDALRREGPLTRSDLASALGLSPAKIGQTVRGLIDSSLVTDNELGPSEGGRRPALLRLASGIEFALGIDWGSENMRAVVLDAEGSVLIQERRSLDVPQASVDSLVSVLYETAQSALNSAKASGIHVSGIGLGITGFVDTVRGECISIPAIAGPIQLPIEQMVRSTLAVDRVIINDSGRCMALAEKRMGLGKGIQNLVFINMGGCISGGIFINGELLEGPSGITSEIGHIRIGDSSNICVCGNRGCLESVASGWAIRRQAEEALRGGVISVMSSRRAEAGSGKLPLSSIIQAAKEHDKFSRNLFVEAGRAVGMGIGNIINLISPDRVVIGGGLVRAIPEVIFPAILEGLDDVILPWFSDIVEVRLSELNEYSAAAGAGLTVIDRFFCADLESMLQ